MQGAVKLDSFHFGIFDIMPSSLPLPPVSPSSSNERLKGRECVAGGSSCSSAYEVRRGRGNRAQGRTMKLARLLLEILAYSLQHTLGASASRRQVQSTAACENDGGSFYFNTTHTVGDAALSGCYAAEIAEAETHGVGVFTLNGDEQADGDLVFWASSSIAEDDDGNLVSFAPMMSRLCEKCLHYLLLLLLWLLLFVCRLHTSYSYNRYCSAGEWANLHCRGMLISK